MVLTAEELQLLHTYHNSQANYYLACKQANVEISKKKPLYTFAECQTEEDWKNRANGFEDQRKYHRVREREFLKLRQAT